MNCYPFTLIQNLYSSVFDFSREILFMFLFYSKTEKNLSVLQNNTTFRDSLLVYDLYTIFLFSDTQNLEISGFQQRKKK